jgi:hypothetical protein
LRSPRLGNCWLNVRQGDAVTNLDTAERVERVIVERGQLGVKPTPEAVAQIMVDQDAFNWR